MHKAKNKREFILECGQDKISSEVHWAIHFESSFRTLEHQKS